VVFDLPGSMLDVLDATLDAPEIRAEERYIIGQTIDLALEPVKLLVESEMPVGEDADLGLDTFEDHLEARAFTVTHAAMLAQPRPPRNDHSWLEAPPRFGDPSQERSRQGVVTYDIGAADV